MSLYRPEAGQVLLPMLPPEMELPPSIDMLWQKSSEFMLSYDSMENALRLVKEFNHSGSTLKGKYLLGQFCDVASAVNGMNGYLGIFGTGYPFYALHADGSVAPIKEIDRYADSFLPKVEADRARGYGAWVCAACQHCNDLPDLKTLCNPCDSVALKPRDPFKALPDLDIWVIVEEHGAEAEAEIEDRIAEAGFYTSDRDIQQSISTSVQAMKKILEGQMPTATLPIDLHIVSKQQMIDCFSHVPTQLMKERFIPVTPRSMHVQWEAADQPYNFLMDFVFSMTPYDWHDLDLANDLFLARAFAKKIMTEGADQVVAPMAPKVARMLETPDVKQILLDRVDRW